MARSSAVNQRPKKRAIALAGGGPVAGFHIGALSALEAARVRFDVWSLSCIGAWVGIYYNQLPEHDPHDPAGRAARTHRFFREHAFRDTASYEGFPVNKAFAPNFGAFAEAWARHASDAATYQRVFNIANELPAALAAWGQFWREPARWGREADRNLLALNGVLALNPVSRFITSLIYQSGVNGLSNIYYRDSSFLEDLQLGGLDLVEHPGIDELDSRGIAALVQAYEAGQLTPAAGRDRLPEIYHNAWRLADGTGARAVKGQLQLFNNRWLDHRLGRGQGGLRRDYLPITRPSLCACSALPYIEQTVNLPNDDGRAYSEGALVDTVSFRNLVEDHPDLDEIWVVRIVDYRQVRRPHNLHDSLGNLCQQFAAEVGENDIDLFKTHLRKCVGRVPRVVEIPLPADSRLDFRWDHENLDQGVDEGREAVAALLRAQPGLVDPETSMPAWAPPLPTRVK